MSPESQQGSSYSAEDLIRHLWSRRYILIIVPVLAVVLGYLGVRAFVPETFESSATLLIRTPAVEYARSLPAHRRITPPGYEAFFETDEVLRRVVDEARRQFPTQYAQRDFERIRRTFSVRTITTRETTVAADYSPVILLEAQGGSPEIAKFVMDTWIRVSTEHFGAMRHRDAQQVRQSFQSQFEEASEDAAIAVARRTEVQRRLAETGMVLDATARLLTGQVTSRQRFDLPSDLRAYEGGQGGAQFQPTTLALLQFLFESVGREPLPDDLDLFTERLRLQLRVAELSGQGSPGQQQELMQAEARLARVQELIEESLTELEELGLESDRLSAELKRLDEEVRLQEDRVIEIRKVLAGTTIEAISSLDPLHPDFEGEFSVIGAPVEPETRSAPPRSLLAIAMGIIFGGLLLLLIVAEFYLKRILEQEPPSANAA